MLVPIFYPSQKSIPPAAALPLWRKATLDLPDRLQAIFWAGSMTLASDLDRGWGRFHRRERKLNRNSFKKDGLSPGKMIGLGNPCEKTGYDLLCFFLFLCRKKLECDKGAERNGKFGAEKEKYIGSGKDDDFSDGKLDLKFGFGICAGVCLDFSILSRLQAFLPTASCQSAQLGSFPGKKQRKLDEKSPLF